VEPQIQAETQPLPQEGRLHDPATLPRLLTWLSRGEWSGLVSVKAGDVERRIYFVEGRVGTAGSTDPADSLASRLIREGLLTDEDRSKVAGQHRLPDRGYAFGRQLVKLGMLSDDDLRRAERRRVVAIAEATLALRTGTYACEPGVLAGDAQPPQGIEVPRIVAEGMLMHWEANAALEVLGGRDAIADLDMEHLAEHESTGADESYDYTVLLCNGRRSIGEILAASPLPEPAALRFLAALRLLGIVSSRPAEVAPEGEVEDLSAADEVVEPVEPPPLPAAAQVASADGPPAPPARPVEEPVTASSSSSRAGARAAAPAPPRPTASVRPRTGLVVAALVILLVVAACVFAWLGWREMTQEPAPLPASAVPAAPGAPVVVEESPAPAAATPVEPPAAASAPDGGAPKTP
jgi:hypothetical protein